jgi:hypothetical protein
VRDSKGALVKFDPPDAMNWSLVNGMNNSGDVIGFYYAYPTDKGTGFLRNRNGAITTFAGAPSSINAAGIITGNAGGHGFIRDKWGNISTFDPPDARLGWTEPTGINPSGVIVGRYIDEIAGHGFLRNQEGVITTFDVPGADNRGPFPMAINPSGDVTGYYWGTDGHSHGFVLTGKPD